MLKFCSWNTDDHNTRKPNFLHATKTYVHGTTVINQERTQKWNQTRWTMRERIWKNCEWLFLRKLKKIFWSFTLRYNDNCTQTTRQTLDKTSHLCSAPPHLIIQRTKQKAQASKFPQKTYLDNFCSSINFRRFFIFFVDGVQRCRSTTHGHMGAAGRHNGSWLLCHQTYPWCRPSAPMLVGIRARHELIMAGAATMTHGANCELIGALHDQKSRTERAMTNDKWKSRFKVQFRWTPLQNQSLWCGHSCLISCGNNFGSSKNEISSCSFFEQLFSESVWICMLVCILLNLKSYID